MDLLPYFAALGPLMKSFLCLSRCLGGHAFRGVFQHSQDSGRFTLALWMTDG